MQSQPETTVVSNFAIGDRMRYLPTGLPSLDGTGCGGIRLGSVTEVVGRAGAGKTQFALQLVLMAAKYNQGAMYIDTEKKLILERLRDMAARRFSQSSSTYHQPSGTGDQFSYGMSANDSTLNVSGQGQHSSGGDHQELQKELFSFKSAGEVLQNMTVKQPHSTNELLSVLDVAEEEILHRNQQSTFPVRLLIVDSIAAPLKRDFGPSAIPQRAATAFSIAQTLKRLAEQLHLAVIVINQVAIDTTSHHTANRGGPTLRLDQVAVKASLGTSWHHCVSTRMLVDHEVDPHRDDAQLLADGNPCRSLSVVKSNWMPYLTFPFVITPVGIVECRSEMTTQ